MQWCQFGEQKDSISHDILAREPDGGASVGQKCWIYTSVLLSLLSSTHRLTNNTFLWILLLSRGDAVVFHALILLSLSLSSQVLHFLRGQIIVITGRIVVILFRILVFAFLRVFVGGRTIFLYILVGDWCIIPLIVLYLRLGLFKPVLIVLFCSVFLTFYPAQLHFKLLYLPICLLQLLTVRLDSVSLHLFVVLVQISSIFWLVLMRFLMFYCHFLSFFGAHAFGQFMIIGFCILHKRIQSLYSLLFTLLPINNAHLLKNLHLALLLCPSAEFLLCFDAIFDGLADECVGGGSLNIVYVETSEVFLVFGWRLRVV